MCVVLSCVKMGAYGFGWAVVVCTCVRVLLGILHMWSRVTGISQLWAVAGTRQSYLSYGQKLVQDSHISVMGRSWYRTVISQLWAEAGTGPSYLSYGQKLVQDSHISVMGRSWYRTVISQLWAEAGTGPSYLSYGQKLVQDSHISVMGRRWYRTVKITEIWVYCVLLLLLLLICILICSAEDV